MGGGGGGGGGDVVVYPIRDACDVGYGSKLIMNGLY